MCVIKRHNYWVIRQLFTSVNHLHQSCSTLNICIDHCRIIQSITLFMSFWNWPKPLFWFTVIRRSAVLLARSIRAFITNIPNIRYSILLPYRLMMENIQSKIYIIIHHNDSLIIGDSVRSLFCNVQVHSCTDSLTRLIAHPLVSCVGESHFSWCR